MKKEQKSVAPKKTETVTQLDGKIITYFTDNSLWRGAYEKGKSAWGKRDFKHVKKLVPTPDIVVDVGANIGQETIYYADWAKTVYSFEPGTSAHAILSQNVEQNHLNNVVICKMGLSSAPSKANLHVFKGNEGMAYVTPEKTNKTEEIHLVKFDDFCEKYIQEGSVDFVKIDVEGLEMHVLNGMIDTIKKCSPVFQIELKDAWLARNGTSSVEIWDFFNALGYECLSSPTKKVTREQAPHDKRTKADLYFRKASV